MNKYELLLDFRPSQITDGSQPSQGGYPVWEYATNFHGAELTALVGNGFIRLLKGDLDREQLSGLYEAASSMDREAQTFGRTDRAAEARDVKDLASAEMDRLDSAKQETVQVS